MNDPRHEKLASLLVRHSIRLSPNQRCLIQATDVPDEMTQALVNAVYDAGGYPVVNIVSEKVQRTIAARAGDESITFLAQTESERMKQMDAYIGITAPRNDREMGDLPPDRRDRYRTRYIGPVHFGIRVPNTRWVVLRYPTEMMAYQAGMSLGAFEEFFYRVTTDVDYSQMEQAMEAAKAHMERAERVHITGPGTDLSFSIAGLPAVPCFGENNIPDGEIFTAPVRDSVDGTITFNTPSNYDGFIYRNVQFTFENGRIVSAAGNDTARINAVLDTDEGARFVGEFALGCNPEILKPMENTLFDEKIAGSFHFTPGNAYDDCDNTNRSAVHWDLVNIQRPEWGGGDITMDDELIRHDGVFVHPAFTGLNPENLG